MIILANGREVEILPSDEEENYWKFRGHNRNNFSCCNTVALDAFLPIALTPPSKRRDCIRGYPWQCPFAHYPCTSHHKRDNKHLATIEYTNWERHQGHQKDENGQFELFSRGYWLNVRNSQARWTHEPRPYSVADVVCKQFAVASMEFLKRHNFENCLKWRILPVDDDMKWVSDQQVKHSGRYSSCVFDMWD